MRSVVVTYDFLHSCGKISCIILVEIMQVPYRPVMSFIPLSSLPKCEIFDLPDFHVCT
jgi:hypothetical protein